MAVPRDRRWQSLELNPNVWVAPGTDPEGTPGIPVGQAVYLWARVRNAGHDSVDNAVVLFGKPRY